jgi:hypothetical protein
MIIIEDLLKMIQLAARMFPGAELERNRVGNLSVYHDGKWVGTLDLGEPEIRDVDGTPLTETDPDAP